MMNNSAGKRKRKKILGACIWTTIALAIWFVFCDDNAANDLICGFVINFANNISDAAEEEINDFGKESEEYSYYWENVLEEYCLASEFEGQAEEILIADEETDAGEVSEEAEDVEEATESSLTANEEEVETVMSMNGLNTFMQDKLSDYDYIKSNFYNVDSTTNVSREELDGESLSEMDLTIDLTDTDYKILIYHTHGTESFADSEAGNVDDTVIGVGAYLAELLEKNYGVSVYHDSTAYDMKDGTLDRSAAYDYAREGVEAILEEYPSIEVVIDIHRDGVSEDTYLVTEINGKKTAQIMFLNGVSRLNKNGDISYLENPNKVENLAFSLQLYLTARANYDDYVRKIFIKGYRYNLDLMPRALLVEVGSQTNTVEEAKNAMEPLAAILYKVLSGK